MCVKNKHILGICNKLFTFKLILLILLIQFNGIVTYSNNQLYAQDKQSCADNLQNADDAYYDGDFETTLNLVNSCLKNSNITSEEKILAYKILSRTFMAMNQVEKSKQIIKKILDLEPNYLPTIEQETPKFVMMVNQVIQERKTQTKLEEESGISSWIWIGAGSVVATAAAIVIISSGEENKDKKENKLPEPPEFP